MQKLKIDDTLANPKADMGPVIDGASRDRIKRDRREGAKPKARTSREDGTKLLARSRILRRPDADRST